VKTVLKKPQDLAAHLGGVAEYRVSPVGAIGPIGRGGLAPGLLAQCFLVHDSVLTHSVVHQQGHQEAGDNGQSDLILDGRHTGAPCLGQAEVVLPGVEEVGDILPNNTRQPKS